jgi:DNA-binding transcriptional LysR family regulator
MAARADRSRQRRYIRIRKDPPTREITIAWRRDRSRSVLARAFAALVAEQVKDPKGEIPA